MQMLYVETYCCHYMKFLFLYDSNGEITGRRKKYAFLAEYSEVDFEAELLLKDWIAEQNARKPYRKISNVQILEIQKIAYGILDIRS